MRSVGHGEKRNERDEGPFNLHIYIVCPAVVKKKKKGDFLSSLLCMCRLFSYKKPPQRFSKILCDTQES